MTKPLEQVRESLEIGSLLLSSIDDTRMTQTNIDCMRDVSKAAQTALQAHEEEIKEREAVLAKMVDALECCIDGLNGKEYALPDWVIDKVEAALAKVQP